MEITLNLMNIAWISLNFNRLNCVCLRRKDILLNASDKIECLNWIVQVCKVCLICCGISKFLVIKLLELASARTLSYHPYFIIYVRVGITFVSLFICILERIFLNILDC